MVTARIVLLGLLAGCASLEFPMSAFPDSFDCVVYDSGKIVRQSKVDASDPRYQSLKKFLQENLDGWKLDLNSYAPTLYFRSDGMTVNCGRYRVVVNAKMPGGQWTQRSKDVTGCSDIVGG